MRARLLAGTAAGALALGLVASVAALPATAATGSSAKLSVLHGVPDLTVDVWVNGERTLDDFTPGTLAGPLDLPAGTYSVAITAALSTLGSGVTSTTNPARAATDAPIRRPRGRPSADDAKKTSAITTAQLAPETAVR